MIAGETRFAAAIARIDAANAEDPEPDPTDPAGRPRALVYGLRMSAWLDRLRPDAPEPLRLAVRAQHIRRWEIPRDSHPMDRRGYLMWRKTLYQFHADTASALLRECGYDGETVGRVAFLLRKQQLNRDPDTQTLEDCACLVFLEHHYAGYVGVWEDAKIVGILRKTWAKMSPRAHEAALGLPLSGDAARLVREALSGGGA